MLPHLSPKRGVRVVPKLGMPQGNTISFSSSSGDQTSSVYHDKKQGYYTYYLLKTIKDSHGDITMQELFDKTNAEVKKCYRITWQDARATIYCISYMEDLGRYSA